MLFLDRHQVEDMILACDEALTAGGASLSTSDRRRHEPHTWDRGALTVAI